MKYDFSEYQPSDYDKYRHIRSDREDYHLSTFCNSAAFDPKDRCFCIRVDENNENYTMQELIDEDPASRDAGSEPAAEAISEEDESELAKSREEQEAKNAAIIQKMQSRYRLDRERPEHNRKLDCDLGGWTVEPFINVFSGSKVVLNYGEGLLDFIYADFVKPLNKAYREAYLWEKLLQMVTDEEETQQSEPLSQKVCSSTNARVTAFYNYMNTFHMIQDIAYASLYSAICPPCFDEGASETDAIQWYGNYLIALQKEYLELLEFCYDEDFYPEALGKLYPSERFALYRNCHGLPSSSTREETVSFSAARGSGDKMPYGLPGSELTKLLTTTPKITADHIALAEKLGTSAEQLALRIHFRSFMTVEYQFSTIQEILELEFTKMLEQNIRFRKCQRCGRYFIMKGNYDTHYCDRVAEGETRTCQELAAAEKYKEKIAGNKAIPVYNKYYKRYAARVKVHQIREDQFKKWRYEAILLRDKCAEGKISLNEYIQWMEDSFPNRKPKT